MKLLRFAVASVVASTAFGSLSGCSMFKGQEAEVGKLAIDYVDDGTVTSRVKAKYFDTKDLDSSGIKVETMSGTVMLTGTTKTDKDKGVAEIVIRDVTGVRGVKNLLTVRGG